MTIRAERLDGQMTIDSAPGRDTGIEMHLLLGRV